MDMEVEKGCERRRRYKERREKGKRKAAEGRCTSWNQIIG